MEIIYTFYFLCLFKKVIKKLLTFCYWTNKIISTHILTRRMTVYSKSQGICIGISTHILTRRMTDLNDKGAGLWDISTHILTRRMTTFDSK